jgi:putative PIN family toxin of toxin-antitoxin system
VLVSAFAFGGIPKAAVLKAFSEYEICVSPQILQEYRDVPSLLFARRKLVPGQFRALIAGIAAVVSAARVVYPRERIKVCRDPKDDMVLECCLAAGAEYLITGDRDLLSIKELPFRLRILSPRGFISHPL